MSNTAVESCPNCPNNFTEHNPPRQLLNCQHLMCQRCLISQKCCKKCGAQVGLQDHFLKDYPIINIFDIVNRTSYSSHKKSVVQKSEQQNIEEEDQQQLLNQSFEHYEKVQQKSDQIYIQQCLLHFKPADLICLDDNAIICSSCALFGKHKGHEISNRQGVLTKFATFVQDCLRIYDQLKKENKQFNSQLYRGDYRKMLLQKKQNDQKRISQKFQSLISAIKIIEKKQLLKINQLYKQKEKNYDSKQPKLQKMEGQINKWLTEIEDIGALMSDTNNLEKLTHCVPYIDEKNQLRKQVINRGAILMQSFDETRRKMINQLKKQKQSETIKFDEQKIKSVAQYVTIKNQEVMSKRAQSVAKASNFCPPKSPICPQQNSMKFRSSSKKEHLKTETDAYEVGNINFNPKLRSDVTVNCFNDDNLLLSVENTVICLKGEERREIYVDRVQIAQELDAESIPHLSISDIRPVTAISSGQSSDQSRFLQKDRQLRQFVNENLCGFSVQISKDDPKKKKKNEFPQKFKGSVDDLKNDRAQTIDLTGAEVGDASILGLCPYIKKSKKLKTLKLVKNKITDDCLPQLLQALSESKVCSLNLSQNLLTDKCCLLISSSPISPHLKTITLSLNKVNRRNVKSKIDELSKKNITLLL